MTAERRRRDTNAVVTIYWRDIPAQVNGQRGRERNQILLTERFQRAIDRAKRKAKITTAQEDVAQWRRETDVCNGDPFEAATARAAELEADYSDERLGRLGFVGGFEADIDDDDDPGETSPNDTNGPNDTSPETS